MPDALRQMQLRQIDETIERLAPLRQVQSPPRGWLRAIREALGLTQAQVAERLGVTKSMISKYEKAEVEGSITLATLHRVAAALESDAVCVVLPRAPVNDTRRRRAREVAARHVAAVHESMALEGQSVSEQERQRQIADLAETLLRSGDLWDAP